MKHKTTFYKVQKFVVFSTIVLLYIIIAFYLVNCSSIIIFNKSKSAIISPSESIKIDSVDVLDKSRKSENVGNIDRSRKVKDIKD